jgi:hypothetical protein
MTSAWLVFVAARDAALSNGAIAAHILGGASYGREGAWQITLIA